MGIIPPRIDCMRPVLSLTVEVFHGVGVQVGVAADGDHGAVDGEDGQEAGGEEVGTQVVRCHHPFQTF